MRASRAGLRPRQRMLETLVRRLPMVRLTVSSSLLAMVGCTGLIDVPAPTKAEQARQLWVTSALPALKSAEANCQTCHAGARPMVDFMTGADVADADAMAIREKLLAFDPPVISIDAPQSSRLINKGQHEGPPLVGDQKNDVLEWLEAEKDAAGTGPGGGGTLGIRTQDYTIQLCTGGLPGDPTCPVNTISLTELLGGAGVAGAQISFVAVGVGTGLYLNNLKLIPGPQGAFIEHPLFVSVPTDPMEKPIADTLDRFFNTKMNLMPGAPADQQQISGGTAAFVNFPPTNKISVFFKSVQAFQPDGGGGGGGGQTGCKVPASFETNARNALNTSCGGCHRGTNANATSALDLTGVNAPNATAACNQTRLRVNLTAIDQSGIFLATQPGNANHPFTFGGNAANHAAFKTALNPWILAERDAK